MILTSEISTSSMVENSGSVRNVASPTPKSINSLGWPARTPRRTIGTDSYFTGKILTSLG